MVRQERSSISSFRDPIYGFLLITFILLAGCGEKATYTPPPPPKVTVVQPVKQIVTDYLELTGNTQAVNTVQLVARVAGYLEKVLFRDGQIVNKGQLLFRIQKDTYEARLQQAEGQILLQKALLEYAETELTRYSNLLKEKAASQTDVDNYRNQRDSARANLVTAEANRNLAKLDLSYTEVTAPFDGRIDRRLQDPGNMVGSGSNNTVLAEINQIDPIYVYFTISDLDLSRLMKAAGGIPGQANAKKWPVSVGLANEEGYPRQGYLDFAAISLTPTTGTLLMRGILSNPAGKILPGLYARVRMPVEKKPAFLLPEESIGFDQQGTYVLIVNEKNLVERRNIKTGPLVDNLRAVEEGLVGKEWVITKGLQRVAPGRQVTPEQVGALPAPGPSQPARQK
jgi:RND family efflux transporter MFP subunit